MCLSLAAGYRNWGGVQHNVAHLNCKVKGCPLSLLRETLLEIMFYKIVVVVTPY